MLSLLMNIYRWVLTNIASHDTETTKLLLRNDLMKDILFISSLQYNEQCNTNFADEDFVTEIPQASYISLLHTTSWCLNTLCRDLTSLVPTKLKIILKSIIQLMHDAINIQNIKHQLVKENNRFYVTLTSLIDEIVINLAWTTLFLITQYENHLLQTIINQLGNNGIVKNFIDLLDHKNETIIHLSNEIISIILKNSNENIQKCINYGIFKNYCFVLSTKLSLSSRTITQILQNINYIADNNQPDLLRHPNLCKISCHYLNYGTNNIKYEAMNVIAKICKEANKQNIDLLIKQYNLVKYMTMYLNQHKTNQKILLTAINCIENILQFGDNSYLEIFEEDRLLCFLEEIQSDENLNDEIFDKCVNIINRHWNDNHNFTLNKITQPQHIFDII